MKMKKEHFDHLQKTITKFLDEQGKSHVITMYETGNFPRSERVKNLQKRFCFDLLDHSGLTQYVCTHLYPYLNDDHIYTALKTICPEITKGWDTKNPRQ